MSDDGQKNSDKLLAIVKKEAASKNQGRLKIFLGMAAGVGKTYAMLRAAHQLKNEGKDVVVGLVETHGRKDTAALTSGLEILPRKKIDQRGTLTDELDVEAILARRPKVVLVDELAHTNASGSRHAKRYLDVLDLLHAGIDVYSTLNVQHVASRSASVQEISRVVVNETVPDSILDRADEIILIDLTPEELLKRLKSGQIYRHEQAQIAANNFFTIGNLTALREMALRVAAERVDRDLRDYKTLHGIQSHWRAGGRLMVAIFASPHSELLIRWTRRVADSLNVTWIGAYVDNDRALDQQEQLLLKKNTELAQQLGGEVIATRDNDVVAGLMRLARQNNVTQIIVGRTRRSPLRNLLTGGSVVSRLINRAGEIDVYVVATNRTRAKRHLRLSSLRTDEYKFPYEELGWMFGSVMVTWTLAALLAPALGYMAIGILFLLAVCISGVFFSRTTTLLQAFVFALLHDYFFIPPVNEFSIQKPEDLLLLLVLFIAAATSGHLTSRLARKERLLRTREERAVSLYNLSKEIAAAQSVQQVTNAAIQRIGELLQCDVAILIRQADGDLIATLESTFKIDNKEKGVATWAQTQNAVAGRYTDTLNAAAGTYFPIVGGDERIGVLAVALGDDALDMDKRLLIETLVHQLADGLARERYHQQVRTLTVVEETQKLYKSLLDCVSHELKTPLAAIKGSASALLDKRTNTNSAVVEQLAGEVYQASGRLQHLVENMLDMTRIESGKLQPKHELCDVSDLIGTAVRRIDHLRGQHVVQVSIDADLQPVVCDPTLMDHVLGNILHNAYLYSAARGTITICAKQAETSIVITIEDEGPGLPKDNPEVVFEKFVRAEPTKAGGVGLGLSIAKGFLEAQRGTLSATNTERGARFTLHLPVGETP